MDKIFNAKIKSTELGQGASDYRGFYLCLKLEWNCSGQAFCCFINNEKGIPFLEKLMEVVGVGTWEELPGKYVRAQHDERRNIVAIGHITDDKWVNRLDFFNKENQ